MSRFLVMSAQRDLGLRGKYAEEKIRDELKRVGEADAHFDWKREYDARSSMGRIPKCCGDFTYYWYRPPGERGHGVIEVKQVKHDFRLPRKNFDPDGWGILKKRELAGGKIHVVVFHSTSKKWRCPPWGWFQSLKDAKSWDLTTWPQYNKVSEVLAAAGLR